MHTRNYKICQTELQKLVINALWSSWSRCDVIAIDVNTEIFTGYNDVTISSESHIIAVCMLDATFKSTQQCAIGTKNSHVEVVMIVCNYYTA